MSFGTTVLVPHRMLVSSISIVVSAYGYTAPAQIVNLCAITSCPLSGSFSGKAHRYFRWIDLEYSWLSSGLANSGPILYKRIPFRRLVRSRLGTYYLAYGHKHSLSSQIKGCYCNLQIYRPNRLPSGLCKCTAL